MSSNSAAAQVGHNKTAATSALEALEDAISFVYADEEMRIRPMPEDPAVFDQLNYLGRRLVGSGAYEAGVSTSAGCKAVKAALDIFCERLVDGSRVTNSSTARWELERLCNKYEREGTFQGQTVLGVIAIVRHNRGETDFLQFCLSHRPDLRAASQELSEAIARNEAAKRREQALPQFEPGSTFGNLTIGSPAAFFPRWY